MDELLKPDGVPFFPKIIELIKLCAQALKFCGDTNLIKASAEWALVCMVIVYLVNILSREFTSEPIQLIHLEIQT